MGAPHSLHLHMAVLALPALFLVLSVGFIFFKVLVYCLFCFVRFLDFCTVYVTCEWFTCMYVCPLSLLPRVKMFHCFCWAYAVSYHVSLLLTWESQFPLHRPIIFFLF